MFKVAQLYKWLLVNITYVSGTVLTSSQFAATETGHHQKNELLLCFNGSDHVAVQLTLQEKKSSCITFVYKKMTFVWPLWFCSLSLLHTHTHTQSGGVADVGTFVLWDESCFIGTDYCFILPLQTPANITLHTNTLHTPKGDKAEEGNGLKNKFKNEKWRGKAKKKGNWDVCRVLQESKIFYSSLCCDSSPSFTI